MQRKPYLDGGGILELLFSICSALRQGCLLLFQL